MCSLVQELVATDCLASRSRLTISVILSKSIFLLKFTVSIQVSRRNVPLLFTAWFGFFAVFSEPEFDVSVTCRSNIFWVPPPIVLIIIYYLIIYMAIADFRIC